MGILILIIFILIIYIVERIIYKKYVFKGFDAYIKFSKSCINKGEKVSLIEHLSNNKELPLVSNTVKFSISKSLLPENAQNISISDNYYRKDIFSMLGHQRITRQLDLTAQKRGYYAIKNIDIIATDIFMSKIYVKKIENVSELHVFPSKIDIKDFKVSINSIIGSFLSKQFMNEDPFEFKGIREYQPFDKMSSINWKSSAKTNKLMVNENNLTSTFNVQILLNVEKNNQFDSDRAVEYSMDIASSIAQSFIKQNIALGLVSNGIDIFDEPMQTRDYKTDVNHLMNIDKRLARTNLSKGQNDFLELIDNTLEDKKKDTLYIIISNYRQDDLYQKFINLDNNADNIIWIIPHDSNEIINDRLKKDNNIFTWRTSV